LIIMLKMSFMRIVSLDPELMNFFLKIMTSSSSMISLSGNSINGQIDSTV
jgi:hypothetical protein